MSDLVRREVGELLARLTADDVAPRQRAGLLASLTRLLAEGARAAGTRAVLNGRALVDVVVRDVAPHVPVRDLLTLRDHHGGRSGDDLAEALVASAARTTAAVGAAAGALAAAEFAAPPALLAAPAQLVAETVAVVAVELKLVAELHVVYGRAPQGSRAQVTTAYLASWAGRTAVRRNGEAPSLATVLSAASRQQVRSRVVRRLRRNVTSLAPFLAGAVAGAELNRRETRALGTALVRDLSPRR